MGFQELFRLAKGRPWTIDEERHFQSVDQATRNIIVKQLAVEARYVKTEDRLGTDGVSYTAFLLDPLSRKGRA